MAKKKWFIPKAQQILKAVWFTDDIVCAENCLRIWNRETLFTSRVVKSKK